MADVVSRIHHRARAWAAFWYLCIALAWTAMTLASGLRWWQLAVAVAWFGQAAYQARLATDPSAPPAKPLWSKDDADYRTPTLLDRWRARARRR